MRLLSLRWVPLFLLLTAASCRSHSPAFHPIAVVDLGALVTDDLPQRMWGAGLPRAMNFSRQNQAEVVRWAFPLAGTDSLHGQNSYFTLFNHGGPHVDAPNHVSAGGGIDAYHVESFSGPVRVFDVSRFPTGRSIPDSVFRHHVHAGEIVLIWTRYHAPGGDSLPEVRALTREAAEYLATLPVRALGTDAFSVEDLGSVKRPLVHDTFLSRGIPAYEQLQNLDKLLGKDHLFFVGVPLNMKDGDGMMVRPVVFVQ